MVLPAISKGVKGLEDRLMARVDEALKQVNARLDGFEAHLRNPRHVAPSGAYRDTGHTASLAEVDRGDLPTPEPVNYGTVAHPCPVPPPVTMKAKDAPDLTGSYANSSGLLREKMDSERARKLLEETQPWYRDANGLSSRVALAQEPETISMVNRALNGDFSSYDPQAVDHPVLLVLSHVVKLQKRLDANERLIRFLVERASGIE